MRGEASQAVGALTQGPLDGGLPPAPPSHPGAAENGAFTIRNKLSIVSYNSATLFGSVHGSHAWQRKKLANIAQLINKYDIVLCQETHGSEGDLSSLERDFTSHVHFGSFCPLSSSGGCTIQYVSL